MSGLAEFAPLAIVVAVIVVQRLVELMLARSNTKALLDAGAREHGAGHYPIIVLMHVAWLVAWPFEAWRAGPDLVPEWPWIALAVGAAQLLRYAAIRGLGSRWTTRILVLPGEPPIRRGIYKVLPHPNYVAVALELALIPLLFGAWWSAAVFTALNAVVLLGIRIPAENRALRAS